MKKLYVYILFYYTYYIVCSSPCSHESGIFSEGLRHHSIVYQMYIKTIIPTLIDSAVSFALVQLGWIAVDIHSDRVRYCCYTCNSSTAYQ